MRRSLRPFPSSAPENAGIGTHIGGLSGGVEVAFGEQLDGQSHVTGFSLRLAEQFGMEVLEGGDAVPVSTPDVVVVILDGIAVDDRFLFGRQLAGAHQLFAQESVESKNETWHFSMPGFVNHLISLPPKNYKNLNSSPATLSLAIHLV